MCTIRSHFFLAGEQSTKLITKLLKDHFEFTIGDKKVKLGSKPVSYPVARCI
jgi:hypothetical protein